MKFLNGRGKNIAKVFFCVLFWNLITKITGQRDKKVDEAKLSELIEMGYDKVDAVKALKVAVCNRSC